MDEIDEYMVDTSHPQSYRATDNPKNKDVETGSVSPNHEARMETTNLMQGSYEESNFVYDKVKRKIIIPSHSKAYCVNPRYSPGSPPEKDKKKALLKERLKESKNSD